MTAAAIALRTSVWTWSMGLAVSACSSDRTRSISLLEFRLMLGLGNIVAETLVFSTVEGGHLKPNSLSRSWRQTCTAMKLPRVKFHALRHTHASTLIRAGGDVLTISRRLGHSQAAMTLDVHWH